MVNFEYLVPTKIVFGKETEKEAGRLIKEFGGHKALIHWGGDYVRDTGLLARVEEGLAAEGIGARKYFYPLVSDYACYRETYHSSETPVARHLASQVLTLPLFEELGAAGADEICDVILKGPGSNPRK